MNTKAKVRAKLVEYLSDSENKFHKWKDLCTQVCGYRNERQLFKLFTVDERIEIEREALENRRKRYARHLANTDLALIRKAISGNAAAAKLVYQRFEGWNEDVRADGIEALRLPQIKAVKDIPKALGVILKAVVQGKLTTREGEAMGRMLEVYRRGIELADIEHRLQLLEDRTAHAK